MSKKQLPKIINKKILITGGAGFIGSHLVEALVSSNKVTVYDTLRRNALQHTDTAKHPNLTVITGDVLDTQSLAKAMKDQDFCIHLAAIAGVSSYYKNPLATLEVDAWGTYHVLRFASRFHLKHVVVASSSEVYGPHAGNAREDGMTVQGPATDSRWSYGVGKLVGDHFAFAFAKVEKLNVTILRLFNVYGPRQIGEGAISNFVNQAINDKPLKIRGNGRQERAWCYVDDCVSGFTFALGNKQAYGEIFNIGNDVEIPTISQLAEKIISLTNSNSAISYVTQPFAEITKRYPDIKKAREKLGYVPEYTLDEGLVRTISWFAKYAH